MSTIINKQKITPFLWFDGQAEAAMQLYTATFPNSQINTAKYWPEGGPFPAGQVQMGIFTLDGLQFHAFDAGPQFKFTEAISFFVSCKDQAEVDHYWEKLSENGSEGQCGWLKDPFGISWQIVPEFLSKKLASGEPARIQQMMEALMQMHKLDIAALEAAYNQ